MYLFSYKLSALDIERDLLEHPNMLEVAICGVPDDVWGERVGAIVRLKNAQDVRIVYVHS